MCEKPPIDPAIAGMMCPLPYFKIDACDLENYKHPPFMFLLWYLVLGGEKIYEKIKELIDGGGGGGGGGGSDGGGKKDDTKEEKKEEEGGEGGGGAEEEPPAEEGGAEEEG